MDRRTLLKALALGGTAPLALSGCERPEPITVAGNRRFVHPRSEAELVALVKRARATGAQLRVRGSLHSFSGAIFTDGGQGSIDVRLDRYDRILAFDDAKKQVTVQAGIHLGVDPLDPGSTRARSLLQQLDDHGWAFPDLGGITHQTVGGFLSTGSAGGTIHHDVGEAIVCLRIVAGDGNVYELRPNPEDPHDAETNPFYGACVSMGLYGILSTVTFQCIDRYDVIGQNVTTSFAKSPVDLFGQKGGGFRKWMADETYNRALFWPQKGVQKVQLWSARRATAEDELRIRPGGHFVPRPEEQVPELLQGVAHAIYEQVDRVYPPYDEHRNRLMTEAINTFITPGKNTFWDAWFECLPMDNKVSDTLLPTEFTELFVDFDRTAEVMGVLQTFWAKDRRMGRTGPYATEIYPSKASRFWMSPSHGKSQVRVDVFWFKSGYTDPDRSFYPQYWELLRPFGFRFHWGKHLSAPASSTGATYRRNQAPAWDRFLRFRAKFDPDQIFVTRYWREHLGILRA